MNVSEKIDVAVVGIGPAVAMTLLRLAESGINAVGIDSRTVIADKLCTGIIGWECSQKFPPDRAMIHYISKSATIVSPNGTKTQISSLKPQAVILDRISYIQSFVHKARDLGSQILLDNTVIDVSIKKDGVEILTDKGRRFHSKIIVLATGFHSPVLKSVGVIKKNFKPDYMLASQAIVHLNDTKGIQVFLGKDKVPGSFAWLVPTSKKFGLLGMFTKFRLQGHMTNLINQLFRDGIIDSVVKPHSQWAIPARPLRKTFSDRSLLVGDAAGLVKPTTGGGIYYSFLSGEIAAEVIRDALPGNQFSAKTLSSYEAKWKSVLNNEIQIGLRMRNLIESFSDEQIEILLSHIEKSGLLSTLLNSSDMSFDWHSKAILHFLSNPSLWKLMNSFGPVAQTMLYLLRHKSLM